MYQYKVQIQKELVINMRMPFRIPPSISSKIADFRALSKIEKTAKIAGTIGVGAILYDAHEYAKLDAYDKKHTKNADAALKYFKNKYLLSLKQKCPAPSKNTSLLCFIFLFNRICNSFLFKSFISGISIFSSKTSSSNNCK